MTSKNRTFVAGLRKYYQEEIETMIRQMKIEGGTLDDCIAELNILADFVQSQADTLSDAWPNLLKDTSYESWEKGQNGTGTAGATMPKGEV